MPPRAPADPNLRFCADKRAYVASLLALTPAEEKNFWPAYEALAHKGPANRPSGWCGDRIFRKLDHRNVVCHCATRKSNERRGDQRRLGHRQTLRRETGPVTSMDSA